jgi:prepilin-type N-terminal cleavage/methylation domain-containing protein
MTAIQSLSHTRASGSKKGFTLTEIAIVLGIIGLILGAVWAAASSVYANLKANQAQQGILSAAQAVRSMFATSGDTGVTTSTAITSPGMFPTSWASTTPNKTGNPWHVNPTINYAYVIGNGSQFAIELDGISDTGCAQLIAFYNSKASSANGGSVPGLVGNNVTTVAGTPAIGTTTGTAAVPSLTTYAPSNCNGGGLKDNVAITFDMSIM